LSQIRFGIYLPQSSNFETLKRMSALCESLGFDSVWVYDHLIPHHGRPLDEQYLEGWTTITSIAALTTKIRIGILVLCNTFRYPSLVAKMSSTLDSVTNGRLDFGIGAGWYDLEHESYGIPFPRASVRIEALREALTIILGMWTEKKFSHEAQYYRIKDAYNEPKPVQKPHPPIWIGGIGDKILKVAAEFGDAWNFAFYSGNTPEEYRKRLDALHQHCKSLGRNPQDILNTWHGHIIVSKDDHSYRMKRQRFPPSEATSRALIQGTTGDCVAQLRRFIDAGAQYFIFTYPDIQSEETPRLLIDEILPSLG